MWRQLVGSSNELQTPRELADPPLNDNLEGALHRHLEAVHDALCCRSPQLLLCAAHAELKSSDIDEIASTAFQGVDHILGPHLTLECWPCNGIACLICVTASSGSVLPLRPADCGLYTSISMFCSVAGSCKLGLQLCEIYLPEMRILRRARDDACECVKVLFQPACDPRLVQPWYSTRSLLGCLHGSEPIQLLQALPCTGDT